MPLAPDDPRHGTRNAYDRHGCRCDACRQAAADYRRQLRETSPTYQQSRRLTEQKQRERKRDERLAEGDSRHGTYAGWQQYCRCDRCRKALRDWRASRPVEGHHGETGYRYGCRCDVCRAARHEYYAHYRATRGHW